MTSATATQQPTRRNPYLVWLGVLALLVIVGVGVWVYQLSRGMVVTDMRNITSWGLYIVSFMFFVGLSAGGLIISTVPRVFNATQFKPIAKLAVYLSFVCILLSVLFIVPDIGRPERLWHLIAYAHWTSPLLWDVIIIAVYLVLSIVYLWVIVQNERGKIGEGAYTAIAYVSLPVAILTHSITAWIFGLQIGRPFWNSALLAPFFVSSALVSGLALLMLVALILRRLRYFEVSDDLVENMGKLLAIFLIVDLFFLFCELLTGIYPEAAEGKDPVTLLLTDTGAPMFWFEVLVGGVVALVLLLHPATRRKPVPVGVASVLILIAIFFKRFNLLMAGFALPLVTDPSVVTGPASPNADTFFQALEDYFPYFPSLAEWIIVVGIVAFGALLLSLGLKHLPLKPNFKTTE